MASKYKALAAKKFIETFESKVCGIPCIVGVSYYQSVKGSYSYHAASDWDYYGGTDDDLFHGAQDDYGAQLPTTLPDQTQLQRTIDNAAKAAAQIATAEIRRVHEIELKRMKEELRQSEEALKKAKQQAPLYSSIQLNYCFMDIYMLF